MCLFNSSAPAAATVDPAAERRAAEAEAAAKANSQLALDARRKRAQKGVLATEEPVNVLASSAPKTTANQTALGSGGL